MRAAVLGVGSMGRRHLRAALDLRWEVAGICDRKPSALAAAGREFAIPAARHYQDPARLLAEARPECVIVATTAPGHASLTCLAAEAGAHSILCEKPMATSLAECDRMIATCRQQGARLGINHQMRFMAQYRTAREILESDAFAPWTSLTVVGGNIGLAMNGTHYFELLRWLSGEAPTTVSAWLGVCGGPNPRGDQFEDFAGSVRVETTSGKRLYLEIGADQGHGLSALYAGRNGVLVVDELSGQMRLRVRDTNDRSLPTFRYGMPAQESCLDVPPPDTVSATRCMLKALIEDNGYPTGEDGRTAIATLVAAHVSNENGHGPVSTGSLPLQREFRYP